MLPIHLALGLGLGVTFALRPVSGRLVTAAVVVLVASAAWGVVVAVNADDTDSIAALAGGSLLALANMFAGLVAGGLTGSVAAATPRARESSP